MDLPSNRKVPASVPDEEEEEAKPVPISHNPGIIAVGSKVEANGSPSPSPSPVRKGHGLKKWRRVKRNNSISKGGNSSDDAGTVIPEDLSNSVTKPSKRAQFFAERPQKSEGSVSSPNPVFALGPSSLDAGTESENSQDFSIKFSTASVQKARSLRGKNATHSGGQQGKGLVFESTKKARGVRIGKENSGSSMESDLRSFNINFVNGANGMSNGAQSEGRENGGHGGYEENSADYLGGGLSWDADKGRGENHDNSLIEDPLVESILVLQKAQEALEEEVLKFKEIGKDASVDDLVSDTHTDYTDEGNKTIVEFPSNECLQSELVEITKRDVEAELEDLFKQRIEAEVEYLTISRTMQKLIIGVASVDESTISEEQKSTDSELTENKLGDNKNAILLGKTDEKFQNLREEIVSVGETIKIQKRVCKYTLYFVVQLLIIFGVFIFGLSPNYVEFVPT